jgi:5'(3')-deoxyribonucleotidase
MKKTIYFDMDGTIADLYGQENWLEKLEAESVEPYEKAKPLTDMEELKEIVNKLKIKGYSVGIISWLSKTGNPKYNMETAKAKIKWLDKFFNLGTDNHFVVYGTPKHSLSKGKYDILVDDNEEILNDWIKDKPKGKIINAKGNIINELKALL